MLTYATEEEPQIELVEGKIIRNGRKIRLHLGQNFVRVGCSRISIEAAKFIVAQHDKHFAAKDNVILQEDELSKCERGSISTIDNRVANPFAPNYITPTNCPVCRQPLHTT